MLVYQRVSPLKSSLVWLAAVWRSSEVDHVLAAGETGALFIEGSINKFLGFSKRAALGQQMAVCQNLVPLVNIKIAGKWMFIP